MATVYKHRNKWRAEVRSPGHGKISKTFDTKKKGQKWASLIENQFDEGTFVDVTKSNKIPFSNVADDYLAEKEVLKKNVRTDLENIGYFKKQAFYTKPIGMIKVSDMQAYRDDMIKCKLKTSTMQRRFTTLRAIFNFAKSSLNFPVKMPVIELPEKEDHRKRIFIDDEEQRFFESSKRYGKGIFQLVAEFAIETTMRKGEMVGIDVEELVNGKKVKRRKHNGLTWGMVHTDKLVLSLPASITKSGKARDVPLFPRSIEILESIRPSKFNPTQKVFDISPDGIKNAHQRTCKHASIVDFHFHDLRHVGCTKWANKLHPMKLKLLTGHADLRMLSIYYNQEAADLAREIARDMEQD